MATVNQAEVKFIAELGAFQAGVKGAADTLTKTLKPAIQDINKSFADLSRLGTKQLESIAANDKIRAGFASLGKQAAEPIQAVAVASAATSEKVVANTGKIKKSIGDVGSAARSIAPLIGGPFGDLVFFTGQAASGMKSLIAAAARFITPLSIASAGLVAAGVSAAFLGDRFAFARAETRLFGGEIDNLKKKAKELSEQSRDLKIRVEVQKEQLDRARSILDNLIKERESVQRSGFENTETVIAPIQQSINEWTRILEEYKAGIARGEQILSGKVELLGVTQAQIISDELSTTLNRLARDAALGGDRLKYLEGQVRAYEEAKQKALETDGIADETIQGYNQSIQTSIDLLDEYRAELDKLADERRRQELVDAKKQRGSESQLLDSIIPPNSGQLLQARLDDLTARIKTNSVELNALLVSGAQAGIAAYQQLAQGIGDAIGRAIVYQEDLGEATKNVLKAVAANLISTLIQIAAQQLLLAIIGNELLASETGNRVAAASARAAAAAYAAAVETQGLIGLGTGFGFAAAAIAGVNSVAIAGAAAGQATGNAAIKPLAEGGIVTRPIHALIGEAGREAVIPLDRAGGLLKGLVQPSSAENRVTLMVDSRTLAEWTVRKFPAVLRLHGVKG